MRNMLAISDAADQGDLSEGNRGPGRSRGKNATRRQCAHVRVAWQMVRLSRDETRRHLPSRFSAARSSPEERNLERPPDGDERAWAATAREVSRPKHRPKQVSGLITESPDPSI